MNDIPSILLVDDSENDIYILRRALKKADFSCSVKEVHNGQEAINYLDGQGDFENRDTYPLPSLLLLDLNMPQKNGFEVTSWVRSQPALKAIAIIILTASARPLDMEKAAVAGANAYLIKPSAIETLTTMMRTLREWTLINHFPPCHQPANS